MNSSETPLQKLTHAYQVDACLLSAARDRLRTIRSSGDITGGGHELGNAVRDFMQRKLPNKYLVGHGHIIDSMLRESPRLDVIVADGVSGPILARSEDGTRCFPYESVYLIGEVNASYLGARHPISAFTKTCRAIQENLQRQPTPSNYIGNGMSLPEGTTIAGTEMPRNPLFSFMIFSDSGDASMESLLEEYADVPEQYLPNVVCFADGSFVTKFNVSREEDGYVIGAMDSSCHRILQRDNLFWTWTKLLNPERSGGQVLAVLMMAIFEHLSGCVLVEPPIQDYLYHILEAANSDPRLIDARLILEVKESGIEPRSPVVETAVADRRKRLREHYDQLVDESKRRTDDASGSATDAGAQ